MTQDAARRSEPAASPARRVVVPPGLVAAAGVAAVTAVVVVSVALSATWDLGTNAYLLGAYGGAAALGWLTMTAAWAVLRREPPGEPRSAFARQATVVLLVAAAARAVVAISGPPSLSDDIWRYIHDGRTLGLEGQNPFALSPSETDPAFRGNNPDLVTIYQPASQWVFAGLARLAALPHGLSADTVFRLGFSAFDLATIGLLLVALRRRGRSAWWAMLYAWHPLAITEVAGAGHQDPVGVSLLVAGLLLADLAGASKTAAARLGLAAACGAALAASVAVKPVVAPAAVFIAVAWLRGVGPAAWPAIASALAAGAATLTALYLPFELMDGGLERMFDTVSTFTEKWRFNGSLHPWAEDAFGDKDDADLLMGGLLTLTVAAIAWRARDAWWAAGAYLLAALLVSSTVHPWYVLWPLALVPMSRGLAAWVLSLTVTWAYAAHLNDDDYEVFVWLKLVEYVPVYAAVAVAAVLAARRRDRFKRSALTARGR